MSFFGSDAAASLSAVSHHSAALLNVPSTAPSDWLPVTSKSLSTLKAAVPQTGHEIGAELCIDHKAADIAEVVIFCVSTRSGLPTVA